jgi:hypothetical protein
LRLFHEAALAEQLVVIPHAGDLSNGWMVIEQESVLFVCREDHCYPVLTKVLGCKSRDGKDMRMKSDVSESEIFSLFAAAMMPELRHARWKIDFFATDGVDSSRTISPLRGTL